MEAPGRLWGCLRVKVLLIPSTSHLHGSHASPSAQTPPQGPRSHRATSSKSKPLWGARGGHVGITLLLLAWVGGGAGGRREASKALPGGPVTKSRTGVCGSPWLCPLAIWSFSSSSGFSLGSVACLGRQENKQMRHKAVSDSSILSPGQPAEWHLGVHMYISLYPSTTTWLFMPHSEQDNCLHF